MSVPDEKTALTWMVSIQKAQGISGEAVESARRERLATVSALPASVPGADDEAAVASSDEDVPAADAAAMRMTPVDPEDATKLAKRISHVPTDVGVTNFVASRFNTFSHTCTLSFAV